MICVTLLFQEARENHTALATGGAAPLLALAVDVAALTSAEMAATAVHRATTEVHGAAAVLLVVVLDAQVGAAPIATDTVAVAVVGHVALTETVTPLNRHAFN